MKTNLLIFSKDRTLQLKSLLISLKHFSDIEEENIWILYKITTDAIDYQSLIDQFECHFIEESQHFLDDIKHIFHQMNNDYIGFMVDDLIFRDNVDFCKIESVIDNRPDINSFSLRLGKNITHGGPLPMFETMDNDMISYETRKGQGRYWNYFWDLCSSIYRKNTVLEYLSKCRPEKENFPNPFESHYYTCMPNTTNTGIVKLINSIRFPFRKKSHKIACYSESKCFTQGVNVVANIQHNRKEYYSPGFLHEKMLEGYIIDFKELKKVELNSPNQVDSFFKLIHEKELLD